jgi:hypothetical protein
MLLVATNGAAQFFPGGLLAFFDRRPSASGIAAVPLLDNRSQVAGDCGVKHRVGS